MIDTNAWKTNDPEWVAARAELWPLYEKWFNSFDGRSDALPEEHKRRAKDYYDSGKIDGIYQDRVSALSYVTLLLFHPKLTEGSVRQIVNYLESKGVGGVKGSIHCFVHAGIMDLFIRASIISRDVIYTLPHALLGDSYEEAAEILDFDPNVATLDATYKIVGDMAGYILSIKDHPVYYPARMLIPHTVRMLEICGSELLQKQGFTLKKMIKRLNAFDMNNPEAADEVKEFVPLFVKAIKESNITPEIKDAIEDR